MRNIGSVILLHNKQVLNPNKEYFRCNHKIKDECPLDNKCLTPNTVYEAKFSNETKDK